MREVGNPTLPTFDSSETSSFHFLSPTFRHNGRFMRPAHRNDCVPAGCFTTRLRRCPPMVMVLPSLEPVSRGNIIIITGIAAAIIEGIVIVNQATCTKIEPASKLSRRGVHCDAARPDESCAVFTRLVGSRFLRRWWLQW